MTSCATLLDSNLFWIWSRDYLASFQFHTLKITRKRGRIWRRTWEPVILIIGTGSSIKPNFLLPCSSSLWWTAIKNDITWRENPRQTNVSTSFCRKTFVKCVALSTISKFYTQINGKWKWLYSLSCNDVHKYIRKVLVLRMSAEGESRSWRAARKNWYSMHYIYTVWWQICWTHAAKVSYRSVRRKCWQTWWRVPGRVEKTYPLCCSCQYGSDHRP